MADQSTQNEDVKVTLHWLAQSRSQRIVWILEECKGLNYDIKVYNRMSNRLAPPELKEVHPLGKSPVITVESKETDKPLVIAESGAVTEYLCDHFASHLVPKRYKEGKEGKVGAETEQWLRYRFFMHYAEGSLMPLRLFSVIMDTIKDGPNTPWLVKPIARGIVGKVEEFFLNPNYKNHSSFLEQQLTTSPDNGKFLCGKDLTAADILMSFPMIACKDKIDAEKYPKVHEYIKAIESHPGYKNSIEKIEKISGEPFKALM